MIIETNISFKANPTYIFSAFLLIFVTILFWFCTYSVLNVCIVVFIFISVLGLVVLVHVVKMRNVALESFFNWYFSLLTSCVLACILLTYWLFIKSIFCMTIFYIFNPIINNQISSKSGFYWSKNHIGLLIARIRFLNWMRIYFTCIFYK